MANTLQEGENDLVNVNYSDLLTKILEILQEPQRDSLVSRSNNNNGQRLLINIDKIADRVASLSIENPLGSDRSKAKSATVSFSKHREKDFIKQVQDIKKYLTHQIESILSNGEEQVSIEQYVRGFAKKLSDFNLKDKNKFGNVGFEYPFTTSYPDLQKQRLSLDRKTSVGKSPLLRAHKITITVNETSHFSERLQEGIKNFIEIQFDGSQQEDLNFILEDAINNPKSDFDNLQRLMKEEALGKLQREAKVRYLEYLKEQIGEHRDITYLEDLIRRLRLLEQYINDEDKEDGHYEVSYAGVSVNYRTLFSRAEAFQELPIIPIIEGCLGEIKDDVRGKQQFIFGIKLKLNGQVHTDNSQPAFEYHLDKLDTSSRDHQENIADPDRKEQFVRKVLKIALLYYFIFACDPSTEKKEGNRHKHDLDYDPIEKFDGQVLEILKGSDESKKASILRGIRKGLTSTNYEVEYKLDKLKNLLATTIKEKNSIKTRTYPFHISINRGILEDDFRAINEKSSFFKDSIGRDKKKSLKYISVEEANVNSNALCTLAGDIQINDLQYFDTTDREKFRMEYDDISNISTIPILVSPQDDRCQKIYDSERFKTYNLVCFFYDRARLLNSHFKDSSPSAFAYKFTFALLTYIVLTIIFESGKNNVFIPILRLQLTGKDNPSPEEEFMRSLFSVISHLLNEKNRSNCQGLNVSSSNSYKIKNALSSLYSILPKKFQFSDPKQAGTLEKLAIVIVSSRESDRSKKGDYKITNLMGEAIAIQRQPDNSIRLQSYGTFSGNYGSNDIYSHPDCLIDKFNLLYKHGYKNFLYIAKSPYSSTLNMTNTQEDKELFFMSKELIKAVKGNKEDIKIYPVFFDRYSALKIGTPGINSLYIQDITELTEIVKDPNKRSIVFFNLFNGITVAGADRYYNGVISYSTLLNIYENILEDGDIHLGLINDSTLKRDILNYLTLFHFSRYESSVGKVSLKLDPYQSIIGDKSVGKMSVFNQMQSKVNFNLLAFLTQVKKSLNVQPENEDVESCQS
jgi:hypothetical protein